MVTDKIFLYFENHTPSSLLKPQVYVPSVPAWHRPISGLYMLPNEKPKALN